MANRVTLDLKEWFGATLEVAKRKEYEYCTITIPGYLSTAANLKDGEVLEIYFKRQIKAIEKDVLNQGQEAAGST